MAWDPTTDPAATACTELCEQVLARVGDRAHALVTATRGTSALTRFANSRIHQNVASEERHVRLRVVVGDGQSAQAITTRLDDDGLERLVEGTLAAAALRPADPAFPGLAPAAAFTPVDHYDEPTAAAEPDGRAGVVADFVAAGEGLEAAGFCSTSGEVHAIASTAGVRGACRTTVAQLDGIQRAPGAEAPTDGYGQHTSTRLADLDGAQAGSVAAAKARSGADPISLDPGVYEVVLEPKAVAELLLFPAWLGFNGKQHAEGTSFAHLGEQQFDERIDLWDDATDPRALGRPYDAEGTPKRRLDLVAKGVTVGLAHDRRSATLAGVEPTGSAIGSDAFGGYPADLFLGEGDQSLEELVAGVDRGLLVTDLWYNRVLDPKTQVITGLTRNGLFLIEAGEVVGPVQNLRYTQSVVGSLGPGHVLGVGNDARLVGHEGGIAHVPSLRLSAFAFTGNARG